MTLTTLERLRAKREGLSTYMTGAVVLACSGAAGLLVMFIPVLIRLAGGISAFLDRVISYRNLRFARLAFQQNMSGNTAYVREIWPFILLAGALGILLGYLRRRWGLYYREIPWRPYRSGFRLPAYPHRWLTYFAGPLIFLAIAYYSDPRVYVRILTANFAVWLTSGVAALVLWELITDGLLAAGARMHLFRPPYRRLDAELDWKRWLDRDPKLSGFRAFEVAVFSDGRAFLHADLNEAQVNRVRELTAQMEDVTSLEIKTTEEQEAGD
ncbi:MAG TPA: hypothetical protein GXX29_08530 [Firmicutes bacterium]|nr:hypothetical protein [Bacillota bacterium]